MKLEEELKVRLQIILAVSSDEGILIELEIESKKVKEKLLLEKEKCKKLYYNKKGEKVIELLGNGEVIVVDGDNLDDKEISKKEYAKDMLYNVNNDIIISGGNEGINVIDMKEKIEVYLPESYCGENIVLANFVINFSAFAFFKLAFSISSITFAIVESL